MRSSDYTFVTVRQENSALFYSSPKIFPKVKRWGLFIHAFWRLATATVNFPALHLLVLGSNGA